MAFFGRVVSAAVVSVLLSAAPARADDQIRIGVVGPLSGPLSIFGDSLVRGAEAAAAQLNLSHGIMGRKIAIVRFDDGAIPPNAAEKARAAVEANIKFVIGHMTQATSLAAARIYAERKILQIEPRGSRLPGDARAGETLFSLCGPDGSRAVVLKTYLTSRFKADQIGILGDNDNAGSALGQAFSKSGGAVVGTENRDRGNLQGGVNILEGKGAKAAIVELTTDAAYSSKLADASHVATKIPVVIDVPSYVARG